MNDYLIHYGVKGMRWGVRRYRHSDGSLTAKGRKHYQYGNINVDYNSKTRRYRISDKHGTKLDVDRKAFNQYEDEQSKAVVDLFSKTYNVPSKKVYTDLEKKYPNYYNLPSDKQDRLFVQYANDSGLYKYI